MLFFTGTEILGWCSKCIVARCRLLIKLNLYIFSLNAFIHKLDEGYWTWRWGPYNWEQHTNQMTWLITWPARWPVLPLGFCPSHSPYFGKPDAMCLIAGYLPAWVTTVYWKIIKKWIVTPLLAYRTGMKTLSVFYLFQDIFCKRDSWKGRQSQLLSYSMRKKKMNQVAVYSFDLPAARANNAPPSLFSAFHAQNRIIWKQNAHKKCIAVPHVGFCFTPNPSKPLTAGREIQVLWCNLLTEWGPENNITEATDIYGMNHRLYTEVSRHHNTAHNRLYTHPFSYTAEDTRS